MMEATGSSKSLVCHNTLKVFVCVMYLFEAGREQYVALSQIYCLTLRWFE